MYCNLEIQDELNALGGLICPSFCVTQIGISIFEEGWGVTKQSNVVTSNEATRKRDRNSRD